MTSSESVRQMVATTVDHFGRLDILVNNAGILFPTRLEQISEEEWVCFLASDAAGYITGSTYDIAGGGLMV